MLYGRGGGNERGETMVFTVYIHMDYDQIAEVKFDFSDLFIISACCMGGFINELLQWFN